VHKAALNVSIPLSYIFYISNRYWWYKPHDKKDLFSL